MDEQSDLPPMMGAILLAARDRFPGQEWRTVEEHIRKAWNAVAHEASWEEVSDPARRAWESARRPS